MNKLLIKVYIPYIEEEFDVYIPINKKIGTIKKLIIDSIIEITEADLSNVSSLNLFDKETGESFENNAYVKDSSIRNGTKLLLI